MDQLKVALAVLKKHHFWVLCGVVILVAIAIWMVASQGLAKQFDERKSTIEGKKQAAESIDPQPPNQDTIAKMSALTGRLKEHVLSAWQDQYALQKRNNPWPALLGREFLDYVELLKPDEEIPPDLRDIYWNFIQENLPALVDIVDIYLPAELDEEGEMVMENGRPKKVNPFDSRAAAASGSYGMGGLGGMMDEGSMEDEAGYGMGSYGGTGSRSAKGKHVGKVKVSQAALSGIRKHLDFRTRPTSAEVRLAQESLWVYAALLRIIDRTNMGASAHYNASVKEIERLDIGQAAASAFGQSTGMSGGGYGSGGYGMEDYEDMGSMGMMGGEMGGYGSEDGGAGMEPFGSGGTGAAAGSAQDAQLARLTANRYVDLKGQPLADASQQPFAEFKMMPVRMLLVIDQRKLPDLLANCANASMPVTPRRVRIEPGSARWLGGGGTGGGTGGGSGYGGMAPMGMSGGFGASAGMGLGGLEDDGGYGEDGGYGDSSYGSAGYGAVGSSRMKATSSLDIPIEVQGIIFIFNPPDRDMLGKGTAGQEPGVVQPAPAAPPAAPPAAAPTGPPATPPPTAPDGGTAPGTGPAAPAAGAGVAPPSSAPAPGGPGTGAPAAGGVTPAPAGTPGPAAGPGGPPSGPAPGGGAAPPAGTAPPGGPPPAGTPSGTPPTGTAPAGGAPPAPAGPGAPGTGG
jgi:hypothetical protein